MMEKESKIECPRERFLPLMCDDIPEELLLKIKKNLNETTTNVDDGLKVLRKCIESENMNIRCDDNYLLLFLRQSKFDVKKAEAKLKNFMKLFDKLEEYIAANGIHRILAAVDAKCVGILPYRDGENRTVVFARSCGWKKEVFDIDDLATAIGYLGMFSVKFPLTSLCGINYIADGTIDNLHDLLTICNGYRKYLPYMKFCPLRIHRSDIINANYLCRCLYTAIRPILPPKIKNRVFLHGNDFERSLLEVYPLSMMPHELGGTMGPLTCEGYREEFFEFMKNFMSDFRPNKN